jgi:hypothetical protein
MQMRRLIDEKDYDSLLAQFRGAQAAIWSFHVSHSRLAICLQRKGDWESDALFLVAVSCQRICGPFYWDGADIAILYEAPNERGERDARIVDANAGFELLSRGGVVITLGPPLVTPPDYFLGPDFVQERGSLVEQFPVLAHESAGVRRCCGYIVPKIEGNDVELRCNECGAAVGVVKEAVLRDLVLMIHDAE